MFSTLEWSFLALDWDPDLKKRYFDENAAEVSHGSSLLSLFHIDQTVLLHSFSSTKYVYFAILEVVMC